MKKVLEQYSSHFPKEQDSKVIRSKGHRLRNILTGDKTMDPLKNLQLRERCSGTPETVRLPSLLGTCSRN